MHGIPIAKITFSLHDNDKKIAKAGVAKVKEIMNAAGAQKVVQEPRYAHLVGGARMGNDPATSVTDKWGRTHDVSNLFICDGSILPTQGSANPGLTIQSLAARTADYLISNAMACFPATRGVLIARTLYTSQSLTSRNARAWGSTPEVATLANGIKRMNTQRAEHVQKLLKREGYHALVCRTPQNMVMLTGYQPLLGNSFLHRLAQ